MATRRVLQYPLSSSSTNSLDLIYLKTDRYDSLERVYGTIPTGKYATGDIIRFPLPATKIVHAEFRTGNTISRVWPSTDLSSNVSHAANGGAIDFDITYRRGSQQSTSEANTIKLLTTS